MIAVRPTADGDLPGLDALFRSRFGHPLSAAAWAWKYRSLPGEARSLVAVDGSGAVVAHGGALRLAARWRDGEGGIWQLADFAGAAEAGSGLRPPLVALGRELLAELPAAGDAPWIFGFPSERHFRLGERVFGYRPLATITPLAGPLPGPAAGGGGVVESGDSCGDWAAAAWEGCGVLGVRRTAAFLNWRYWARPERYYRFYRLWSGEAPGATALPPSSPVLAGTAGPTDGATGAAGPASATGPAASPGRAGPAGAGEMCGLAVFAFVGEEAWAAELWLPPAGEWYAPMLAVAADLRLAGLTRWRFWPPPAAVQPAPGAADLLARLGVQPEGEPRFVGCRTAAGSAVDPAAAAAGFYYAMGDYDLV